MVDFVAAFMRRYWRLLLLVALGALVFAFVVPVVARQGTYFGISPWVTFGTLAGAVLLGAGGMLVSAVRGGVRVRDLVAWTHLSAPGSAVHVIEPTRGLRGLSSGAGTTDPRFWAMAVGRETIEMWAEPGRPPVVVIRRSAVRRATVERVDFSTHRGPGVRVELRDHPVPIDFGLHRLHGLLLGTPSSRDSQAVAASLTMPTRPYDPGSHDDVSW